MSLDTDEPLRFGLLLTSAHSNDSPPATQIAEHRQLTAMARDMGFELLVAGQHFGAPSLRYLQPIPYLASLAAHAGDMRIATGILLLPLLSPLATAEEMATLDAVTGGRAVMGVGIGYSQREFDAFGVDRAKRTALFEEAIDLIRRLWDGETIDHVGERFSYDQIQASITPVQDHLPIWVGAQADPSVRRAARIADTWYVPPFPTHRELVELWEAFCDERTAHDRPPPTEFPVRRELVLADTPEQALDMVRAGMESRYSTYASWGLDMSSPPTDENWMDGRFLLGPGELVAERLTQLRQQAPMSHFVFKPQWPTLPFDHAVRQLERFGEEVLPHFRTASTAAA